MIDLILDIYDVLCWGNSLMHASQGRRLLHTEAIAMEYMFLPQSVQGGGVLRGSDALPSQKSRGIYVPFYFSHSA